MWPFGSSGCGGDHHFGEGTPTWRWRTHSGALGTGNVLIEREYKQRCQHSGCHETRNSWEYERSVTLEEMRAFGEGDQTAQDRDLGEIEDCIERWRNEAKDIGDEYSEAGELVETMLLCANELEMVVDSMEDEQ